MSELIPILGGIPAWTGLIYCGNDGGGGAERGEGVLTLNPGYQPSQRQKQESAEFEQPSASDAEGALGSKAVK